MLGQACEPDMKTHEAEHLAKVEEDVFLGTP